MVNFIQNTANVAIFSKIRAHLGIMGVPNLNDKID
jgi:hypothetical protein